MYRKILIPTDGSKNSVRSIKHAIKLADDQDAQIIILYVIEEFNPQTAVVPVSTLPVSYENLSEELKLQGETIIENIKSEIHEACPGGCGHIKLTSMINAGKPYLQILKVMEDENVDLVVMGASGKHGLDRVIVGSVTERVVRAATKPVLIIP